jgi:hypothetical protein
MKNSLSDKIIYPDPWHHLWWGISYELVLDGRNYLQIIAQVIAEK